MINRLSLIAYPPEELYNFLHNKLIDAGIISSQRGTQFNGFDPHITFAYWPSKRAPFEKLNHGIKQTCMMHLPIEVQYKNFYISDYNTVNISIEPKEKCKKIHNDLLNQVLPYLTNNKNKRINEQFLLQKKFETFNTNNILYSYDPHLTVIKTDSREKALMILNLMNDFPIITQTIENLILANATFPPLKPQYKIIS